MTLTKATLKSALQAIAADAGLPYDDEDSAWHNHVAAPQGPSQQRAAAAELWATAVGSYAGSVVPACTVPAATAAQTALQTAIATTFAGTDAATTAASLETAFLAYATALGAGMVPGFVATPPSEAVGFATLFTAPYPATHAAAAQRIADAIDTWLKTGTAVPSGGGPAVHWG